LRISFVITNAPPLVGGLEKVCLRVAQNLQKLGHDVTIFGRFTQGRHQMEDFFSVSEKNQNLECEGVNVRVLTLDAKARLLLNPVFKLIWRKSTFPLARWLYVAAMRGQIAASSRGADVVHFFGNGPEMLGFAAEAAARKVGAKFVVEPALHEGQWGDKWFDALLYKRAHLLLAHTRYEAGVLERMGMPATKIRTIVHGVDFCDSGDGGRFRKKHGIAGPMVLFLGRKTQEKGVGRLLEAWPMVVEKFPEATLVFAGPKNAEFDKLKNCLTTNHANRREKGNGDLTTEDTENTEGEAGLRPGSRACAAFSNPSTSEHARDFANTSPTRLANVPASSPETRHSSLVTTGFSAEGPVLQAQGLPQGDLIKALLTNWSVVPHACLFRRSILEKAGGFPEDIWVGEDQLLFLRCLLAGAKVVHTPGTMVFYRLGEEGKLTESKVGQRRRVVDWGKFLVKASEEVSSGELRVARKRICLTTEDTECTEEAQGNAQRTCACASKSDSLASELADSPVSESLTRSASIPAAQPETSHPLLVTTTPSAWFGFRLRAYEAWRDLRAFFPGEFLDLETGLQAIWKRSRISGFGFQVSGFLMRKLGGLKQRLIGHRWPSSFCSDMATKTSLEAMMK
jgi:glycosyltransferase involved in cell wall biosynthesis